MAVGSPDYFPRMITSAQSSEQLKVDVTDVDSSENFTQACMSILVYNGGPNAVHFNEDAAATTDHFLIPAKSWLTIDIPVTTPHFICAATETATVYVLGVY